LSPLPNREIIPHPAQMMRLRPMEPDPASTPVGEMKIPDPENETAVGSD